MPMQERTVGGGPATGLADDFVRFLQQGLNTGSFGGITSGQRFNGANPEGQTGGMASVLNDILAGGAGNLGGSMAEMISRDTERNANNIRSRFGASGGMAFGTPAMRAESMFRAEAAPAATQAIGGMQMNLLSQLLPLFANLSGKGIAQRETLMEENPWMTALNVAGTVAPIVAAPFTGGASLAAMPATAAATNNVSGGALNAASRDFFGPAAMPLNNPFDPRLLNMFVTQR